MKVFFKYIIGHVVIGLMHVMIHFVNCFHTVYYVINLVYPGKMFLHIRIPFIYLIIKNYHFGRKKSTVWEPNRQFHHVHLQRKIIILVQNYFTYHVMMIIFYILFIRMFILNLPVTSMEIHYHLHHRSY